ncbi:MAG: pre-peptidase C-terminal domain-containing protein [Anaerolineae bacterium]|nr:pre-peptidase C-terminal domain-containing protein [Anaerolineae bacterium]
MFKWSFLLVFALGVYLAAAQDYTPIAYNQTVSGFLSDDDFRQLFVFDGRQGEIITIRMNTVEGDLDPYLVLVDQTGRGIAFSDDEGEQNAALIDSFELPASGQYFIVATRFGHEHGSTSGTYELNLTRQGVNIPSGASLQYGDVVIGEITPQQSQVVYYFSGRRGEVVNLQMRRTSGDLDAFIDIANQRGQILRSGDDDPRQVGSLNAAVLNFTLPENGFYIVVATRYGRESGTTMGSYMLSLDIIPEEARGLAAYDAILLDYGSTSASTISAEVPQRFYFFEGQRGDVITVVMSRTQGNLNALLILLDEQLSEVFTAEYNTNSRSAEILNYTLPKGGTYYLMATRADFSEGQTEGDFELSLTGRRGIDGSKMLEVFYGTEMRGVIDTNIPYESFLFYGEQGDVITITMERTTGDLDSLLTLYQGSKQIAFDDDSGGSQNAAIQNFTLPQDGVYRIEASRFERESGTTSGTYILLIVKER